MTQSSVLKYFFGTTLCGLDFGRVTFEDAHGDTVWARYNKYVLGADHVALDSLPIRAYREQEIIEAIHAGKLHLASLEDLHFASPFFHHALTDASELMAAQKLRATLAHNFLSRRWSYRLFRYTKAENCTVQLVRRLIKAVCTGNTGYRDYLVYVLKVKHGRMLPCWECQFDSDYANHRSGTHHTVAEMHRLSCSCSVLGECDHCYHANLGLMDIDLY